MKNYGVILIALLTGITIFSVFKYVSSLREKNDLTLALSQIKNQATALENERQNLLQELEKEKQLQQQLHEENTGLKESLMEGEEKLAKINADFAHTQEVLEQLNSQLANLKEENTLLKEEKDKMNIQLAEVTQEKDDLKARFSSVAGLKKAIRELKIRMRKVGVEIKRKVKYEKIIEGNRGFLIKDGKTTFPTKVKIEVVPVSSAGMPALENEQ